MTPEQKIKRLEEVLESCRDLSWQRAQEILELRKRVKELEDEKENQKDPIRD
jgi:hypothetical protein